MESEEKAGWQNCVEYFGCVCVCVCVYVCVCDRGDCGEKNEYLYIAQNVSE